MFGAANVVSSLRIACAPMLLVSAWAGEPEIFLSLFVFCLVSDSVDGLLARHFGQSTPLGAQLDSWGDFATMVCMPIGVAVLWPDIVVQEFRFIALALLCYVVPTLFGILKYGRLPSFHTWGAKISVVVVGIALLVLFMYRRPLLFRLAVPLLVLEAIEEIAMTALLPRPRSNLPSLWHALKLVRESGSGDRGAGSP